MAAKKTAKKAAVKVATKKARDKKLNFKSVEEMRAFLANEGVKDQTYRMVERPKPSAQAKEAEPEPTNPTEGAWGPKPSVKRQLTEHPTTVRTKATTTRQFVLSNEEHLKEWNEIQARMHPVESPEVRLCTYESQFSPNLGSFVLHVSYAELEYQQL